jgi:hypothetical protein
MSQENVDLAGEVMNGLSQRDPARLIGLADPEVEWHSFFRRVGRPVIAPPASRDEYEPLDSLPLVIRSGSLRLPIPGRAHRRVPPPRG